MNRSRKFWLTAGGAALLAAAGIGFWMVEKALVPAPGAGLERQLARLGQAAEEARRADDALLPPPADPGEAAEMSRALARRLALEGVAGWDAFRAEVGARGRPETVAGLDRAWGEFSASAEALRRLLDAYARSDPAADQPGLDAKRAEDYVNLESRFAAASDALYEWAARLSPADFAPPTS